MLQKILGIYIFILISNMSIGQVTTQFSESKKFTIQENSNLIYPIQLDQISTFDYSVYFLLKQKTNQNSVFLYETDREFSKLSVKEIDFTSKDYKIVFTHDIQLVKNKLYFLAKVKDKQSKNFYLATIIYDIGLQKYCYTKIYEIANIDTDKYGVVFHKYSRYYTIYRYTEEMYLDDSKKFVVDKNSNKIVDAAIINLESSRIAIIPIAGDSIFSIYNISNRMLIGESSFNQLQFDTFFIQKLDKNISFITADFKDNKYYLIFFKRDSFNNSKDSVLIRGLAKLNGKWTNFLNTARSLKELYENKSFNPNNLPITKFNLENSQLLELKKTIRNNTVMAEVRINPSDTSLIYFCYNEILKIVDLDSNSKRFVKHRLLFNSSTNNCISIHQSTKGIVDKTFHFQITTPEKQSEFLRTYRLDLLMKLNKNYIFYFDKNLYTFHLYSNEFQKLSNSDITRYLNASSNNKFIDNNSIIKIELLSNDSFKFIELQFVE